MMHFMGFDLSSERGAATSGQMSEEGNGERALLVRSPGAIFRS